MRRANKLATAPDSSAAPQHAAAMHCMDSKTFTAMWTTWSRPHACLRNHQMQAAIWRSIFMEAFR